jgi:hypothetical protein
MRWSEAGYLSQFVLTHALRQVSVSLIFDVRQNKAEMMRKHCIPKGGRFSYVSLVLLIGLSGCAHHSVGKIDWKDELATRAMAGDGEAARVLAGHYSTGDYQPRLARYWAGVGAANGDPICIYHLGLLSLQALGGPHDEALGRALLQVAAKKGVISTAELEALLNEN